MQDGIIETQAIGPDLEEFAEQLEGLTPADCYAKLFSVRDHFGQINLQPGQTVIVGRADTCTHQLKVKDEFFGTYSSRHFQITWNDDNGSSYTCITDLSTNGTFINGEKLGKNKSRVLANNDQIALAVPHNKAWSYVELHSSNALYPKEVTAHYTVSRTLGTGAFGEVKLVFETDSCKPYAMKILSKKSLTTDSAAYGAEMLREVNIMKQLRHPNIVRIERVIDTDDRIFIVLEYVEGGELFDRIVGLENSSGFDSSTAKLLCFQMAHAVKYLHDNGITHRDLKPENLLLKDPNNNRTMVKLTDFGVSKLVSGDTKLKTQCGTPSYYAPEIITANNNKPYTNKVDVWSLGVIFFITQSGYPPFTEQRDDLPLDRQICEGKVSFPKEFWHGTDRTAIELIKRMLTVDPDKRYSIDEVCQHAWFQDAGMKVELKRLLDEECCHWQLQHYLSDWTQAELTAAPAVRGRKRKSDAIYN